MDCLAKGLYIGTVTSQGTRTAGTSVLFEMTLSITAKVGTDGQREALKYPLARKTALWFNEKSLEESVTALKYLCSVKGIPYIEDPVKWNLSAPNPMDLTGVESEFWCSGQDKKGYDRLFVSVPHSGKREQKTVQEDAGAALALRALLKGTADRPATPTPPAASPGLTEGVPVDAGNIPF